ncbi:hypothetical protein SLS56_004357 [Neofusicoccum ribis]|uniref:Cytochrome P450 n=1 Tax=Neofusicoccum ribis TaxID=45134 RepID=A0ABR3SXD4_9PEZI
MARNLQNLLPQDEKEWTKLPILQTLVPIVAQLMTKVFTGEPLCNNPEWINISINFTIEGSMASRALRSWPAILRPLIYRFIPERRQIQNTYSRADELLQEELFSDVADSRQYSVTQGQLLLSFAAIHTTSTTLYAFLFDLLSTPSLIPELRDEISTVQRDAGGLTKTTLHKLNLLDSCLKERQRLSPLGPSKPPLEPRVPHRATGRPSTAASTPPSPSPTASASRAAPSPPSPASTCTAGWPSTAAGTRG